MLIQGSRGRGANVTDTSVAGGANDNGGVSAGGIGRGAIPGARRAHPSFAPASSPLPPRKGTLSGNRLTVRDMRQIDPSFTSRPAIWVRDEALVVSIESVRAVILSDRMFIFDPDNDNVQTSLWHIEKRLAHNIEDAFMPFEFRALEGILIHACLVLETDLGAIDPKLRQTLAQLPLRITKEGLEQLRQLQMQLNHYYARVRKVQQVIQALLDEDEDMAEMYLTEKRKNPSMMRNPLDHDEVEMLLETYLQMVDDLTSRGGLLNQAIDDTENLIEIHLDTTQNRVLLVDLMITAITTTFSLGTLITSIFGMNLPLPTVMSELPHSHAFFWGAVGLMMASMGIALCFLMRWCRNQGLYSTNKGTGHLRYFKKRRWRIRHRQEMEESGKSSEDYSEDVVDSFSSRFQDIGRRESKTGRNTRKRR